MATPTMRATKRTVLGKQVKALRRAGHLPGVVYGPVMEETVPIVVDRREFERAYQRLGHSTLITLTWDGGERPVFIRDVQMDYIKRQPLHVDFFAPNLQVAIKAMVPLVLHNPNPHVDGVLTELLTEVEVEAKPEAIPHQIDADISALAAPGDAFRIGDLSLPAGVVATGEPETVLVHIAAAPTEEEVAESQALPEVGAVAEAVAEAENAGEAPSEAE
jgi:large subunit ribosomal protein L25